jgi:Na+/proline symporter
MVITPTFILVIIALYFVVLLGISKITSKTQSATDFYIAGRKSPWYIVAFGMIGASLSGVTFISIPGAVGAGGLNMQFAYMQMVFGYLVGYLIIATVLMPIYYKMNSITIYQYLEERFGIVSYKVGAGYFILSRVIGASFRLYLVAIVLHSFVMQPLGISFGLTVIIALGLIYSYTYAGGLKTIIWTDTLQTLFMLVAVITTVVFISNSLGESISSIPDLIYRECYSQLFFFENGWSDPNNFYKQFISGALIALVMTGLDQDMMQKNLSCKSLKEAQWNVTLFSVILVFVNALFLALGALLYIYAQENGVDIPEKTDQLFGLLSFEHFPPFITICFILGLIAAAYSSADSALTALTTSFSVDILESEKTNFNEAAKSRQRKIIHLGFSVVLAILIIVFNSLLDSSAINALFKAAGYTYGPMLGLYAFGILTKRTVKDRWVWIICLLSPILSYVLNLYSEEWFNGFTFGFLILLVNGLLTFIGLYSISSSRKTAQI